MVEFIVMHSNEKLNREKIRKPSTITLINISFTLKISTIFHILLIYFFLFFLKKWMSAVNFLFQNWKSGRILDY